MLSAAKSKWLFRHLFHWWFYRYGIFLVELFMLVMLILFLVWLRRTS